MPACCTRVPGNGGQRILLHVTAPADAVATSANAQVDAPHAPTPAVSTAAPKVGAGNAPSPPVRLDTPAAATLPSTTTVHADTRAAPVTPPADAAAPGHNDHARTLACDALVSRNDPAEKARYLGFFSRSCAGYAMPSAWTSNDVASATPAVAPATGPRWPPRPGPAFDCSQA